MRYGMLAFFLGLARSPAGRGEQKDPRKDPGEHQRGRHVSRRNKRKRSPSEEWEGQVRHSCAGKHFSRHNWEDISNRDLQALDQYTLKYLNVIGAAPDDRVMGRLIRRSKKGAPRHIPVIVLACLPYLSKQAALDHLKRLMALSRDQYLKTIVLASRADRRVVKETKPRVARALLALHMSRHDGGQEISRIVQLALWGPLTSSLVPQSLVAGVLEERHVGQNLNSRFSDLDLKGYYRTLYDEYSWTRDVADAAHGDKEGVRDLASVLDTIFSPWRHIARWEPDQGRITIWEDWLRSSEGSKQHEHLVRLMRLDGPDVIKGQPNCLSSTLATSVTDELPITIQPERLLKLLSLAVTAGGSAVDFFISVCITRGPLGLSIAQMEWCLEEGSDSDCFRLDSYSAALDVKEKWSMQVERLCAVVGDESMAETLEQYDIGLEELRQALYTALSIGKAGMCGREVPGCVGRKGAADMTRLLAARISNSAWFLAGLDEGATLLKSIRSLPSWPKTEISFEILEKPRAGMERIQDRFQKYLECTLNDQSDEEDDGLPSLRELEEEVELCNQAVLAGGRDISLALSRLNVNFRTYLDCLAEIPEEPGSVFLEMNQRLEAASAGSNGIKVASLCITLAPLLERAREQRALLHKCWLQLFAEMMQTTSWASFMLTTHEYGFDIWADFAASAVALLEEFSLFACDGEDPGKSIPETSSALSFEALAWWKYLSQRTRAIKLVLEAQGAGNKDFGWLYFGPDRKSTGRFLDLVMGCGEAVPALSWFIMSGLKIGGENINSVLECMKGAHQIPQRGQDICCRIFALEERRSTGKSHKWIGDHTSYIPTLKRIWSDSPMLDARTKAFLRDMSPYLMSIAAEGDIPSGEAELESSLDGFLEQLHAEYQYLINHIWALENTRAVLSLQNALEAEAVEATLGIQRRLVDDNEAIIIPHDLVDAVETLENNEFDMYFSLEELTFMQRRARGMPVDARVFVVRLRLGPERSFCMHWDPVDGCLFEQHKFHSAEASPLLLASCSGNMCLFEYYVGQHVHSILADPDRGMGQIYDTVSRLLSSEKPLSCVTCLQYVGAPLWQPSYCSEKCRITYNFNIPHRVLLRALWEDPLVIDLLLNSIFAAAGDPKSGELLRGCPVPLIHIRTAISNIPPLENLSKDPDTALASLRALPFGYWTYQLLVWLCKTFGGFLMSAPDHLVIPSMPHTRQFLMLNGPRDREEAFSLAVSNSGPGPATEPVFHGTAVTRLFPILSQGLKSFSQSPLALHGAAMGPGIYVALDQMTAMGYAGNIGCGWPNTRLSNLRVLLGCELANCLRNQNFGARVIKERDTLAVRYIFLVPQVYSPPIRGHVAPAMNIAFAALKAGR